jgi:hypothetical protein
MTISKSASKDKFSDSLAAAIDRDEVAAGIFLLPALLILGIFFGVSHYLSRISQFYGWQLYQGGRALGGSK